MTNLFETFDAHRARLCLIDTNDRHHTYGDILDVGETLAAEVGDRRQVVIFETGNDLAPFAP